MRIGVHAKGEAGNVMLLGIGFIMVILTAIAVTAEATSAFLQRADLQARADAAVLAGAQGIDYDAYYKFGASEATALVPSSAVSLMQRSLTQSLANDPIPGVQIDSATVVDGTIELGLSAPLQLTFFPDFTGARVSVASAGRLDHRPA